MTDRMSTMLTDHCLSVDESQEPVSFEEILERSGDLETIPYLVVREHERQTNVGATAAWIVAATLAMAALAVVIGSLRPSDTALDPAPPVGSPTTIAHNPSFLRPVGPLGGGRYLLAVDGSVSEIGVFATVPEGWVGGRSSVYKARGEVPLGGVSVWEVDRLYGNSCHWEDTLFDPGPSVADLANALLLTPLRLDSTVVDASLSGFMGRYLEWSLPEGMDISECDSAPANSYDGLPDGQPLVLRWQTSTGGELLEFLPGPGPLPGRFDRIWILDVDGTRIVIDVWRSSSASTDDIEQLERVVRSLDVVAP